MSAADNPEIVALTDGAIHTEQETHRARLGANHAPSFDQNCT